MFTRISDQYRNATVAVIGAGGIGGAIVQLMDPVAGRMIVGDRDEALLAGLKRTGQSTVIDTRRIDVRNAASVDEFFSFAAETGGPPDFLFYTAGILNLESLADTTSDLWDTAVEINLNGAFYACQAAARQMIPRRKGSILVLGSIAGTKARSGSRVNPVYNTTKAGLAAFVNAAAMQFRPHGIRINCISPGPTATGMMALQPPQVHDAISQIALDHRQNDPVEVAETALFVAAHGRFTGEDVGLGGGAGLGG